MNNNFIEIEINPNYIQFPILQNGEEVYAMKYPRNVMIMSNNFYEDETIHCIGYDNDNNIMNINNIDNSNHYHTMQEEFINAQGCASAQTAQTAQIPGFHHLGIQAGSYEMRSESRLRPS